MHEGPDAAIAVVRHEFPNIDGAMIETAVKRMLDEGVYPSSVEIAPQALAVAIQTQITLGNLQAQLKFSEFVGDAYIRRALAAPR